MSHTSFKGFAECRSEPIVRGQIINCETPQKRHFLNDLLPCLSILKPSEYEFELVYLSH